MTSQCCGRCRVGNHSNRQTSAETYTLMNLNFRVIPGSIQIVRGLLMSALSLGMLGFVLSLLGMECTFIGGKDRSKHKKINAGGWCHIISGNIYLNRTISQHLCRTRQHSRLPLALCLYVHVLMHVFIFTGGFRIVQLLIAHQVFWLHLVMLSMPIMSQ